ncbi:MAG: gliding motility-associated ABC transporter permease subunit GldF [Bacteroidales bacterium]|nr:gliding motility-associated ABC transporter permease subunit GldF [Bacteroidales bacterium]
MFTLFLKEIKGFFSSVIGYLVIAVFLLILSLFMWVFPTNFNIFQVGSANIDTLFLISPWVFLFLVPAITMNMFADELRTGNMELLLTRPISELKIVLAKYLAAVVLVLIALLPTLLFLISINSLADPVGNVDYGAIIGSYIGLFLLGSVYAAIGIFASSLSKNVIVSFLLGILFCFLFYLGFELLADLISSGSVAEFIKALGINDHYSSISRGVVDSRDIVYFISVIAIFVFFSKIRLESRKW